ncbi:DNA-binding domain-containing protein, AraC-type [Cupriavidus sp. H19C3]|uniref:helix-turn-helix domain-containing protein n=1 Tax=Cupriavidus sp. H19C3 TaxID=3241603 RepID=UPI003BF81CB9
MTELTTLNPELTAPVRPAFPESPIGEEMQWREHAIVTDPAAGTARHVPVLRWIRPDAGQIEVAHDGYDNHHCIALSLRSLNATFLSAGRLIVQGRVAAGAVQITAPKVKTSAVFESASDVLHLFVPQPVLTECHRDLFGREHNGDIVLSDPRLTTDTTMERLGQALAMAHTQDPSLGRLFIDSVSMAIVSRLVSNHFNRVAAQTRHVTGLPAWRLRRVVDYIDAHLSEAIGLADIAESAGLTRMHFAAQFRLATGLRPHEYLLRRRIEHAQDLLRDDKGSVLDVALRCGFRSQAHFTTVFRRFVGDTPYRWRSKVAVTG